MKRSINIAGLVAVAALTILAGGEVSASEKGTKEQAKVTMTSQRVVERFCNRTTELVEAKGNKRIERITEKCVEAEGVMPKSAFEAVKSK